jgi:hypothetical protein
MKIQLTKLRQELDRLLEEAEKRGYNDVEVSSDLYWSVPRRELFDANNKPVNLTLGSLADDIETVRIEAEVVNDAVLSHALTHASGLLRALAENIVG